MGETSATGVAFTRNPSTQKGYFGEFLFNAQGEDVVVGLKRRKTSPRRRASRRGPKSLRWKPLCPGFSPNSCAGRFFFETTTAICRTWNSMSSAANYGCCRHATKRTSKAALRIAVDMTNEGSIGKQRRSRASIRPRSNNCCIQRSIPFPPAKSSPPACRHRRARRAARSCWSPATPSK